MTSEARGVSSLCLERELKQKGQSFITIQGYEPGSQKSIRFRHLPLRFGPGPATRPESSAPGFQSSADLRSMDKNRWHVHPLPELFLPSGRATRIDRLYPLDGLGANRGHLLSRHVCPVAFSS